MEALQMREKQFYTIMLILDGCKDLQEAKAKVQKLIADQSHTKDD